MGVADGIGLLTLGLALALRPLAGGQPYIEVETTLVHFLVGLAFVAWLFRGKAPKSPAEPVTPPDPAEDARAASFRRGMRRLAWPLAVAGVAVVIATATANLDGNGQLARDQAWAWLCDLALFLLAAWHGRRPDGFRFLLGCLAGGLAIAAMYAFYQTVYATQYFRYVFAYQQHATALLAGSDEVSQRMFQMRVDSARATSAFGYANALGNYILLLLPISVALAARATRTYTRAALDGLTLLGLLALMYSGGMGAILAAKMVEGLWLWMRYPRGGRLTRFLAAVGWVTVSTAVAGFVAMAAGSVFARLFPTFPFIDAIRQTVFALLWFATLLVWRRGPAHFETMAWLRKPLVACGLVLFLVGGVAGGWLLSGIRQDMLANHGTPAPTAETANAEAVEADARKHGDTFFDRARISAAKTLLVRWGYWQGALAMAADHPVLGVGLDNFGQRYGEYKSAWAWPVRRVHNLYLQLLADGGVILLGAALFLMTVFLRMVFSAAPRAGEPINGSVAPSAAASSRRKRRRSTDDALPPETRTERHLRLIGMGLGPFALLWSYACYPLTYGLSFEFLQLEWLGGPESGSQRAATGAVLPLLIHAFFTLVALPAAWVVAFDAVWKTARRMKPASFVFPLALGAAGSFLHGFTDFVHSTAAISTTLAALAGLAWAATHAASTPTPADEPDRPERAARPWDIYSPPDGSPPPAPRWFAAGTWSRLAANVAGLVFLILLFIDYHQSQAYRKMESAVDAALIGRTLDPNDPRDPLREASLAVADVMRWRRWDPDLMRQAGRVVVIQSRTSALRSMTPYERGSLQGPRLDEALNRRGNPRLKDEALEWFSRARRLDPYFAAEHAEWARYATRLYPDDPERKRQVSEAWSQAVKRNPTRPQYRLSWAEALDRLGEHDAAREQAAKALELDRQVTAEDAFLTGDEKMVARLLSGS